MFDQESWRQNTSSYPGKTPLPQTKFSSVRFDKSGWCWVRASQVPAGHSFCVKILLTVLYSMERKWKVLIIKLQPDSHIDDSDLDDNKSENNDVLSGREML